MLPVFLLLGALLFGNERPVDPPEYGISLANQSGVVASDGNDHVVIWADDGQRVWSAHVSSTGEVFTRPSRLIANDNAFGMHLFWIGDHYVAMWVSNVQNAYSMKFEPLGRDGAPLAPVRTILPYGAVPAWNGHEFLLAAQTGTNVDAVLLTPDGNVKQAATELALPQDTSLARVIAVGDVFWIFQSKLTVVTITDRFGNVTYSSYTTDYARRINGSGELLDAEPRLILDKVDSVSALASNGRSIVGLAFAQQVWRPFVIDAATGAVTTLFAPLPPGAHDPEVVTDGSTYLLAWLGDGQSVQTMPFDEIGNATPQECCRGALGVPSFAWNFHSYLGVWADSRDSLPWAGSAYLYGTMFDANGHAADDGHPIASAARTQTAVSTSGPLVVWTEYDANGKYQDVRASIPGGAPIVLSSPATAPIFATAALSAGSSYFAGWTESGGQPSHVFMQRVGAAAPLPLGIGTGITFGFDGTNVLAVWLADAGFVGQRFKQDGNIVDAVPFLISKTAAYRPRVAWNGSEYLVTWWDGTRNCIGGICRGDFRDVKAARISPEGAVLQMIPIATGSADQYDPVVASDGHDFLVAYSQEGHMYARRVLADGSVIDSGTGFAIGDGDPIQAIWRDDRYIIAIGDTYPDSKLIAIEVDAKTATVTGNTVIAEGAGASQPLGGATVAYARTTNEPLYGGAVRAFTKPLLEGTRRRSF